jgi:glycerate kinase
VPVGGGALPPLVVCAPNAFKGTLSATAAAHALCRGVRDAGCVGRPVPVADGGDGTLDVLLAGAPGASVQAVRVAGPTGRARSARLGWIGPGVAVVEMAEAAGLRLMGRRRDPMGATSAGVGGLILAALDGGAHRVLVGVGGSASTDGGAGILEALGARLLDRRGRPIPRGGGGLAGLAEIDLRGVDPRLRITALEVAVDVRNPLAGGEGAAHVYAEQKGADRRQVAALDAGLRHLGAMVERVTLRPGLAAEPGTGAAGGAAFALAALGARLLPGAALVCDQVGLDEALGGARLVITGEGRLDSQTAAGKAPAEVAVRAKRAGVPCIAVCGTVVGGSDLFTSAIALDQLGQEPQRRVRSLLRLAAARAVRLSV